MKKKYAIETEFTAKNKFSRTVNVMNKGLSTMGKTAKRTGRIIKKTFGMALKLGRAVGRMAKTSLKLGVAGIVALGGAVVGLARSFSKIEDAQASFTPLLGSVGKAKEMVDALNKTAATTPFQFETLSSTAMQLLPSMNGNIERTIELTRMLGDTAGGNAQKMESITRGYNKALIKGKVDLESLNMIAEAGVPIFQELGKETGITGKKLFKNISKGKVSVEDLTNTFKTMTSKGGIFFKGMEIASQTLSGKISTLKDNLGLAAAEIGDAMAPALKELTDEATDVAKSIGKWARENKTLIRTKFKEYIKNTKDAFKAAYKWIKKNTPAIKEFFGEVKDGAVFVFKLAKGIWENKWAILALVGAYKTLGVAIKSAGLAKAASEVEALTIAEADAANRTMKLQGALSKLSGAMAAFGVGWSIGTVLNDKFIEPVAAAIGRVEQLSGNADRVLDKRLSTMSKKTLDTAEKVLNARLVLLQGLPQTEERMSAIQSLKGNIGRIRGQRASLATGAGSGDAELQGLAGQGRGGGGAFPYSVQPPASQVVNSESTNTEKTEITIKDQTGRAEVTKGGKGGNLKLDQTGGMI